MVIVFVIDNYLHQTNGTTITTRRFIDSLKSRGHDIRILSTGSGIEGLYSLKERYMPIVSAVAKKQDVVFSKPDKKVIVDALTGADIVHFVTPWKTSQVTRRIAEKMSIPTTASFHIQPENITYGAGLSKLGFINTLIYRKFRKFYGNFYQVHAPSNFIAKELKKRHYPTTIKVISNGVSNKFFEASVTEDKEFFHIVSTGRYAKEKNQITLLKAVLASKYKDRIKVTLPGHGPLEANLKQFAEKNQLNVDFGFYSQDELIAVLSKASLYVHPANIEIEAIACLEAIAVGLIPVIANAKKSATPQFALTDKNLFMPNDVNDLKNKIEYWIENEQKRKNTQALYEKYAERFRLDYSIDRFEEMLTESIREEKATKLSHTLKGKVFSKTLIHPPVKRTLSAMTYYLIALPLLYLYMKFVLNVKYRNRKHFKGIKGGAVVISNHVHIMDSAMNSLAAFPKRPIMTAEKENFAKPVAGFFVNLLGAVPIPNNILETQVFFNQLSRQARQGRFVHVYPEGELIYKDSTVRTFKRGAFKLAVESSVPIVTVRISFEQSKFLIWDRQRIILNVGLPLYPDLSISTKAALEKLQQEAVVRMNEL